MTISQSLTIATLLGAVAAGSACAKEGVDEQTEPAATAVDQPNSRSREALDATKDAAVTAVEETKEAGEKTADVTESLAQKTADEAKEIAGKTADKTKEIVGAVGSKTTAIVSTTGETITDGWITTKVSAKFVDETLLKGSNVNVDTKDRVVTLRGTVGSEAAKARAAAIASGTEGVTRVVNQLVVK